MKGKRCEHNVTDYRTKSRPKQDKKGKEIKDEAGKTVMEEYEESYSRKCGNVVY